MASEAALPRTRDRARREPGAGLGRWPLRGVALLYLGLMILLPVAAILQSGFSHGLTDLRSALSSFGAWDQSLTGVWVRILQPLRTPASTDDTTLLDMTPATASFSDGNLAAGQKGGD